MIPVKLRLKNFMSYAENVEPLEFTGMHLACLCGDNGHGKSALLDAITWALWGKARVSDRRDSSNDELIHLGKNDMEVELEFELDSIRYIVLRRRTIKQTAKNRVGSGTLELHVRDLNGLRLISGNSMSETQRKINEILKLDYETFVNSAFILQGRADEFTRKTAGDRKRILADLLSLGFYDKLEENARVSARSQEATRREKNGQIDLIDRDLSHEPEYILDLSNLSDRLILLEQTDTGLHSELNELRARLHDLDAKAHEQQQVKARIARNGENLKTFRARLVSVLAKKRDDDSILTLADRIIERHKRLIELREELGLLDEVGTKILQFTRKKAELDRKIAEARSALLADQKTAVNNLFRLNEQIAREPALTAKEQEITDNIARLSEEERRRDDLIRCIQDSRSQITVFSETNKKIEIDGKDVRKKLDLLAHDGNRSCPLCEQNLDEKGHARLLSTYNDEIDKYKSRYEENKISVKLLEASIVKSEDESRQIDKLLAHKNRLNTELGKVKGALLDIATSYNDLEKWDKRKAEVDGQLADHSYARTDYEQSNELKLQIEALAYDERHHSSVRASVQELADAKTDLITLQNAQQRAPELEKDLADLRGIVGSAESDVERDEKQYGLLNEALANRAEVEERFRETDQQLNDLARKKNDTRQAKGEAQQRLNNCAYLREERKKRQEEMEQAKVEKSYFDDLVDAFGKNGIQAMLIEAAIPEIEREANDILARMTDGRLAVRLETQRDARTGKNQIETLDIRVSDELGTRSLELYSGGESFRVNFAIRIALSKLLARRAGARVQTLVIDEGFGSQDAFGRQRLVDAISSVAADFELILVITHIDELKDAFPTRIDVVKGPDGSKFTVN